MRKRTWRRFQKGCVRDQGGSWILKYYDAEGVQRTRTLAKSLGKGKISRNEAERMAAEFLRPFNEDPKKRKRETSFADFVMNTYVPIKRDSGAWRKGSEKSAVYDLRRYVLPALGSLMMGDLEAEHLRRLLRDLRDRGLGKTVLTHARWHCKAICKLAVSEGYLDRDVAEALDEVTPTAQPRPKLTVTAEQYQEAWRLLDEPERLAFDLVLFCGLRVSEVYALQVGDLMADRNGLEIRRSWDAGQVNLTKTEEWRKVGVPAAIMERLRSRVTTLPDTSSTGWLFPSLTVVTPLWPGNVLVDRIKPRLKPAGYGWLNFAVIRRTHSTEHERIGTKPSLVARQQGHSLDVHHAEYVQTDVAELESAATKLYDHFDEVNRSERGNKG